MLVSVGLLAGAGLGPIAIAARPLPADDAATRIRHLDALFAHLKTTTVEEEGDAMVAEIWKLWLQSGRPEMDALMEQAVALMGNGLPALAMPLLDDIVARAPEWAEGWNKRATLFYVLGDHDRSLADIDRDAGAGAQALRCAGGPRSHPRRQGREPRGACGVPPGAGRQSVPQGALRR